MGIWQAVCMLVCLGIIVGSQRRKPSRQSLFNDEPLRKTPSTTMTSSPDDGELPSEIPCAHRNQCGRYARLPFHARNCFCDSSCRAYGDCCRDYPPTDPPGGTADRGPVIPHSIRGIISCRRVEEIDTSYEMYIVDSCPKGYKDRFVVDKCHNELTPGLFHRLPVTGSTTGVLYRNVYCAICAGDLDVIYWEMAYRCPEADWMINGTLRKAETAEEFRRLANHLRCPVEMIAPTGKRPRKCKSNVDRCPRKWRDERVATKCKSHTAYVYHGLQVFKNKHCAICNNIDEAVVQCDDTRTPWADFESRLSEEHSSQSNAPSSVYIVFDTNTGSGIIRRSVNSISGGTEGERRPGMGSSRVELGRCSEGNVYDVFTDTCRFLGCRDGKCYQTTVHLETVETETEEAVAVKTTRMPSSTVAVIFSNATVMPRPTSTSRGTFPELDKNSSTLPTTTAKDSKMAMAVNETTTRDKTQKSKSKTTSRAATRKRTTTRSRTTPRTTSKSAVLPTDTAAATIPVPATVTSSTAAATSSVSSTTTTITSTTPAISTTRITTTLSTPSTTATTTTTREAFVLVVPFSTVSVSSMSPPVEITDTTGTGLVKVTRSVSGEINSKGVKPVAPSRSPTTPGVRAARTTSIVILSDMHNEDLESEMELLDAAPADGETDSDKSQNCSDILVMFQFDRLQSLASFVGTLTSLVSLLISFIAIIVLPSMRGTIRGKVLLSLMLSLFVAQLLYLVSLPSNQPFATRAVCYWTGTVMHYCVLAVFFWVSVLAIDTTMNIMGNNQRDLEPCESWGRFFGYSLYAWMTPAVIVAACLTAEALKADRFLIRPCYGEGVCWVTGRFALLLAVAFPAGVLTLVSLFLFFLSASHMCVNVTYKDLKTKRNRRPDTRRLALCVCLTLVVALTWVSGFVATFTGRDPVWWVFIAFSSLQGVFICVAFVCTRKVFQRLRDRGQGGKGSLSTNWSYQKDRGPSSVDRTSANRRLPGAESEIVLHETSM